MLPGQVREPDWRSLEAESLRHFQSLVRMDTSDPPGNEAPAVAYLKETLEREGISTEVLGIDPKRPNLIARIKGSGSRRPLLIMGHTDTVGVQADKWTFGPFSAARDNGYIYGRGTVDDKDNVTAALMVMLLLKRTGAKLDRDVIFLAEAGEEGSVKYGIKFMVDNHYAKIDAEYCLAEGGGAIRRGGKLRHVSIATSEKIPYAIRLVARGAAGHGSRPLRNNAILSLSRAVAKAADWRTPMRLNDTTRAYFERLATISPAADAARYNGITHPDRSSVIQDYFAENEPGHNSMLRTSISPNMINGGYRVNVIPSSAEAILDIRALPDENFPAFIEQLKRVIGDSKVELFPADRDTRPGTFPSRIDNEAFRALEASTKRLYPGAVPLPTMLTGATDMAYLRARGMQCYGIGPMTDEEDGPRGYGAHSDQERILETELHRFVRFHWEAVIALAAGK
jgi:acetylornithine deacetylase/succinyl-diaminopimelate desuccinylase-like protein